MERLRPRQASDSAAGRPGLRMVTGADCHLESGTLQGPPAAAGPGLSLPAAPWVVT